MKTVLKYLRPYYTLMATGFAIKTFGTLIELLLPYILSHILKNVIDKTISEIVFWGLTMAFCAAIGCICNVIANRKAAKNSSKFAEDMRRDLFMKILRLSAAQTDRFTIPSLESRITTDTYHIHSFLNMIQRMGVRAPILIIGGIAITLVMDSYLSLVMFGMLLPVFGVIMFVRSRGVPLYSKVQKSVDSMIRVVREDVQGIRVIKALSKSDYEHRRFDDVNSALVKNEKRAGIIMSSVHPIMSLSMNIGSVAVIALGASRVSGGLSEPETIIAFMQYFTQISMAMMAVTRMFNMYSKCAASAKRVEEVLMSDDDVVILSKEKHPDISTDAHIVFDDVSFSYNGIANNIQNISFSVGKGGSIGIIGATGSGKSTLIKLLMRFYDVSSGAVYINGEDIRTIDKKRLYAMFGSAQQYDFLYADTIEENIRFGRDLTDEQITDAAKTAQAHDFISSFMDGYKHMLSQHGTNISGGQKQRLLISRAIAAKPQILILDDSSSALDYKTDAALRQALDMNLQNSTVVTVAQRVSSVKDCDIILVLENGAIIGCGTHDELLENCREYKEISDSQMGGAFID